MLRFFSCRTATLHCFAPKPSASQIPLLLFALAAIHMRDLTPASIPKGLSLSSCSPACCTHPLGTLQGGLRELRQPVAPGGPAAPGQAQSPWAGTQPLGRHTAPPRPHGEQQEICCPMGPGLGSPACIWQGNGLAFLTSFSRRA